MLVADPGDGRRAALLPVATPAVPTANPAIKIPRREKARCGLGTLSSSESISLITFMTPGVITGVVIFEIARINAITS